MTEPIKTTAGPFPRSFVGIHFDNFLKQIGVQTAPHFLERSPQDYVSPGVFEMQKLALMTGAVTEQRLAAKANKLFGAFSKMNAATLLGGGTSDIVIATIAHQVALYSYLATRVDYEMYQLYAQIHEVYYLRKSENDAERRDNAYRAAWGRAHQAQRFQDRGGEWRSAWSSFGTALDLATVYAGRAGSPSEHMEALGDYLEIAQAGPPQKPLNLEEALKTLNPGGTGEVFRSAFMTELKRFLSTRGKEFPPEQQLTFSPFELADQGSRILLTTLHIEDAAGGHNSYPLAIQVSHISGFDEEKASRVGTTVVSIFDDKR